MKMQTLTVEQLMLITGGVNLSTNLYDLEDSPLSPVYDPKNIAKVPQVKGTQQGPKVWQYDFTTRIPVTDKSNFSISITGNSSQLQNSIGLRGIIDWH